MLRLFIAVMLLGQAPTVVAGNKYQGRVTAIVPKSVTLKDGTVVGGQIVIEDNQKRTKIFQLLDATAVMLDQKRASLADIKVGMHCWILASQGTDEALFIFALTKKP
jgi:hypothetical protein